MHIVKYERSQSEKLHTVWFQLRHSIEDKTVETVKMSVVVGLLRGRKKRGVGGAHGIF